MRIHHTPRTICFFKYPAEESNLVQQFRKLSCSPSHPQGMRVTQPMVVCFDRWLCISASNVQQRSEQTRHACATTGPGIEVAIFTPRPVSRVARSGIEPDPAASEAAVRSTTLTSQIVEYPDLESNQNLDFRRVPCGPLHHQGSKGPTAGFAPTSSGLQDRRLSVSSHVGNSSSNGARIRTPCDSFGGCLLSQEHTAVKAADLFPEAGSSRYFSSSSTFQ